jgi:hypothetical protein
MTEHKWPQLPKSTTDNIMRFLSVKDKLLRLKHVNRDFSGAVFRYFRDVDGKQRLSFRVIKILMHSRYRMTKQTELCLQDINVSARPLCALFNARPMSEIFPIVTRLRIKKSFTVTTVSALLKDKLLAKRLKTLIVEGLDKPSISVLLLFQDHFSTLLSLKHIVLNDVTLDSRMNAWNPYHKSTVVKLTLFRTQFDQPPHFRALLNNFPALTYLSIQGLTKKSHCRCKPYRMCSFMYAILDNKSLTHLCVDDISNFRRKAIRLRRKEVTKKSDTITSLTVRSAIVKTDFHNSYILIVNFLKHFPLLKQFTLKNGENTFAAVIHSRALFIDELRQFYLAEECCETTKKRKRLVDELAFEDEQAKSRRLLFDKSIN